MTGGILSGNEIIIQQQAGGLYIEDFSEERLNPNSYNLRLAPELLVYREAVLDPKQDNRTEQIIIPDDGLTLRPGELYLARTMEWTESRDFVPKLEGRSSLGRLGLFVHVTAGFGDVGFAGNWTLELTPTRQIKVYPGMEICQISYLTVSGEITQKYNGKYQGSRDVVASRIYKEFTRTGNVQNVFREEKKPTMTRKEFLDAAAKCVCTDRNNEYGGPEDSFKLIAELWEPIIRARCVSPGCDVSVDAVTVALLMAELKIARAATNEGHMDSWVDLAGYAACGGEIAGKEGGR